MTRINLIPVNELTDQHLLSEHREIKRIPNIIIKGKYNDFGTPKKYKLGNGHVKFFYFKIYFLHKRYLELYKECLKRGFNIDNYEDSFNLPVEFLDRYNDFFPNNEEIEISQKRILEKIQQKPGFYKYYGKVI